MKRLIFWTAALVWTTLTWGQETAAMDEQRIALARSRIEAERQQQSALLAEEDNVCLSRFAVTDCQNEVAQRRRAMLARLKRDEVKLNDAMRRQRARDQMERTLQKKEESAAQRAEALALPPAEDRQKLQDEKVLNHPKPAPLPRDAQVAKAREAVDAKVLQERAKAFSDKQNAAQTKRQERDQRLREKGPAKTALPVPP